MPDEIRTELVGLQRGLLAAAPGWLRSVPLARAAEEAVEQERLPGVTAS